MAGIRTNHNTQRQIEQYLEYLDQRACSGFDEATRKADREATIIDAPEPESTETHADTADKPAGN